MLDLIAEEKARVLFIDMRRMETKYRLDQMLGKQPPEHLRLVFRYVLMDRSLDDQNGIAFQRALKIDRVLTGQDTAQRFHIEQVFQSRDGRSSKVFLPSLREVVKTFDDRTHKRVIDVPKDV
jgi:hypothetical protein